MSGDSYHGTISKHYGPMRNEETRPSVESLN